MKTPLIFIHGFKGCALQDPQKRRLWLDARHVLTALAPPLALPIHWEQHCQAHDHLKPGPPLTHVLGVKIYGPFLKWAATLERPVHVFAYDWRRDNNETTEHFERFLDTVSPTTPVQVVAHSMGGLITMVAMRRRPERFHSALFAGTPFGAGLVMLKDMHAGLPIGFNRRIMSAATNFSFASAFTFYPTAPNDHRLTNTQDQIVTHDWYNPADWVRHAMGPFASQRDTQGQLLEHLSRSLHAARRFRYGFEAPQRQGERLPPLAALVGDKRPTADRIIKNGPRSVRGYDFDTAPRSPGDGIVSLYSAMPPLWTNPKVFTSQRPHSQLLNDLTAVRRALESLPSV